MYITKVRVGDRTEQTQKLFYELEPSTQGEKSAFLPSDELLIIDDFTNSGGTLFGAVNLARKLAGSDEFRVTIFVSHLVATYDDKVVEGVAKKLQELGPNCRFCTTNTIPSTTALLKDHPQVQILDVADFISDMVTRSRL